MCGIAGLFDPRPGDPATRRTLATLMAQRLVHRGPDGFGVVVVGPAALACQRLAIVDVAHGQQPLASADGRLHLVCNGEIFNHLELRANLEARGRRFATGSDVEVILHLYAEHGDALVEHLEGQFAFALFDAHQNRLLLARDAFGIAPLFWTKVPGGIAFASEIKGLLAHPAVEARLDITGVDQVFALPGVVSPRTAVVGVHSLPPGHALVVDAGGIREHTWWDLDYPVEGAEAGPPRAPTARAPGDWAQALGEALQRAVQRRLMGEVPVGAYLSGGLDSSLLAALLAEVGGVRDCFSIGFPAGEGAVDERVFQQQVIAATGHRHHFIEHPASEIPARFARMIRHAECPVSESYNTASLALADAARAAGMKVVLSGEGADELFAGYPGYRVDAARAGSVGLVEGDLRAQLFGLREVGYENPLESSRLRRLPLYAESIREVFEDFDCLEHPVVDPERLRGRHPLHQRSYLDCKLRLADHLLGDHGDRMTMAASVEARFPFLDREVVALARRMPPEVKLGKAVVRAAARGRLPDAIIDRPKMGFHAPGTPGLLQQAPAFVRDLLTPERITLQGVFDPQAVQALIQRHAAPGFRLALPLESDLLMVVLSTAVLVDVLGLAR